MYLNICWPKYASKMLEEKRQGPAREISHADSIGLADFAEFGDSGNYVDPETLQRVRANFFGGFFCEFCIWKCLFGS